MLCISDCHGADMESGVGVIVWGLSCTDLDGRACRVRRQTKRPARLDSCVVMPPKKLATRSRN